MTNTKAELIQASINAATGHIVYTFKLVYPRNTWLHKLGPWLANRLATVPLEITETVTIARLDSGYAYPSVIANAIEHCNQEELPVLSAQVEQRVRLASKVLNAVRDRRSGRITPADAKLARRLFGERFQSVLKIYQLGEWHRPFMKNVDFGHNDRKATAQGWSQ